MKLKDIEASEEKPVYVNLKTEGVEKTFTRSLKWDGKDLYTVKYHGGHLFLWGKPSVKDAIYDSDLESDGWYVCETGLIPLLKKEYGNC